MMIEFARIVQHHPAPAFELGFGIVYLTLAASAFSRKRPVSRV